MAAKVPGSDLRVAAAVPDVAGGPFGLGWLACCHRHGRAARGLAALAWSSRPMRACVAARTWTARRRGTDPRQLIRTAGRIAPLPKPEPAAGKTGGSSGEITIDRGIFRAYDVRGVVGQTLDAGIAELLGQSIGSLMHSTACSTSSSAATAACPARS